MHTILRLILTLSVALILNQSQAADLKDIRQDLSDSVITTKITAKFTKNKHLNPLKISVSTQGGIVILRGHVKDNQAFVTALELAYGTQGVKSVDTDDLQIKPVNTAITDAYITAKVEAAVLKAKVLDDKSIPIVGINATTTNGIVTLSGSVKNNAAIAAIIKRVSAVRGVKKIISQLHVGEEGASKTRNSNENNTPNSL